MTADSGQPAQALAKGGIQAGPLGKRVDDLRLQSVLVARVATGVAGDRAAVGAHSEAPTLREVEPLAQGAARIAISRQHGTALPVVTYVRIGKLRDQPAVFRLRPGPIASRLHRAP